MLKVVQECVVEMFLVCIVFSVVIVGTVAVQCSNGTFSLF